ncbi:clathrin heavy chain [Decorospora gaudefroyi]|uniref:Clathrin heavy chain n=1 Tax=Decorospora gaudefroyi TaxID=184978 RepID=A0A6A5KMI2_9PLEO|nr:clathrin heavy chain [Decorospora gaudefroyi]
MAQRQVPLHVTQPTLLTNLNILPASISWQNCTLESDKYVCVRQVNNEANAPAETVIIDLKNTNNVIRRPIRADSAIMHLTEPIIALKAQGRTLQLFNLETKERLQTYSHQEDIQFWRWISQTTLALVSTKAVYHWDVLDSKNAVAPRKIFDRQEQLENNQIINYVTNDDESWSCLVGITSNPSGGIRGNMQLFSKARNVSQPLEGHAATFGTIRLDGASTDTKIFAFAVKSSSGEAKINIVEVDHNAANPAFPKRLIPIHWPAEGTGDFPLGVHIAHKYGILIVITKFGFIHLHDLETGTALFLNRISEETVFTTARDDEGTGVVVINKRGQVLHTTIREDSLIPYIMENPACADIAYKLASKGGLPGADQLYSQRFEALMSQGNFAEAAKVAANSPRGFLRTMNTINRLRQVPNQPNQITTLLQYFGQLLDKGGLNREETLELARPVFAQGRKHLIEKWQKEGKLHCSEELGDLAKPHDLNLALAIYKEANVPHKVVPSLAELGHYDLIPQYCSGVGYTPDYNVLLQHIVRSNADRGTEFASQLVKNEGGPLISIERVVDIFQSQGMIQQSTAFLLDVLSNDLPEEAHMQTKLLEMNLLNAPQVADAILGNEMFHHYDKMRIAQLCENAGLLTRALEHNDDPAAIKRIIVQTDKLPEEWLINYFGQLTVELSLECLDAMLTVNIRQNLQAVIRIAQKYSDLLGATKIIDLLEKHRTAEGLYFFLGSIVNVSEDPDVHFKYIEAATTMGQLNEVERICRESNFYNPEKVKNFLKEANLTEQLPLIIVCDRYNFIHDLVLYLYKKQQFKSIEVYVQRVNPARTPAVIGGLLDVDCDESIIKGLLASVTPSSIPIDELVSEVESRNRLKLLLPFLEQTLASGNQQQAVYNALAKIYIDSNNNPEKFLKENDQYDTLTVGKYCEKRDPNLAVMCFSKGQNDLELIHITNENAMFKAQARYLLDRADSEIWDYVLSPNNMHRRSLVDQVTSTAVPESTDPDKVSVAVKAFITSDMPSELIDLLEKIILEPSSFSDNPSLQNLLMLTACKSDRGRVSGYIHQLDQYTPEDIAQQCIEVGMYDEAFEIYKKHNNHVEAVSVLIDHIVSLDRATAFADRVDVPEVWSRVAKAQLDGLRVTDSIESYIRAGDPSNFLEVIEIATHAGKDEDLVKFLRMARKTLREVPIDTALAFCFARTNQLPELEDFLRATNVADVEASGDKAYEEGYHEAAKIFYTSISNWAKLATTLVHLEDYQAAVECARKANSVKVWRQVNEACVARKEFRLAQICGLNLIVHAEELADLVKQYERKGYFDELISLLEAGLGLERAHSGMFTALGEALAKYHPERFMEHLRLFWSRIQIHRLIRACEDNHLWAELVFLYLHDSEFDAASLAMMERAADAWEHQAFKDTITKATNVEIYYRALGFYLEEQPTLLTDLLQALTPRIDVNRVVRMFVKSDNIPLIKPFLLSVQSQNKREVNNALNDLLIEEEDYKTLRDSVNNYDNYDPVDLAQRLEKHDLVFFRQIAADIYRKNKRWEKSIALSKQDKLFKDAIETSAMSGKSEIVEDLLRYFVDVGSRECYVGMLYACYDLLRPDVILEMSWRNGLHDFTMPYMINLISQQTAAIELLKKDNEERKTREASQQKKEEDTPILGSRLMLTQGPMTSAPSPSPYGQANGITPQPTGGFRAF